MTDPLTPAEREALRARHTPAAMPPCQCGQQHIVDRELASLLDMARMMWTGNPENFHAYSASIAGMAESVTARLRDPAVLRLLGERDALEAENTRLRAALEEINAQTPCHCPRPYGRHLSTCNARLGDLAREALK